MFSYAMILLCSLMLEIILELFRQFHHTIASDVYLAHEYFRVQVFPKEFLVQISLANYIRTI